MLGRTKFTALLAAAAAALLTTVAACDWLDFDGQDEAVPQALAQTATSTGIKPVGVATPLTASAPRYIARLEPMPCPFQLDGREAEGRTFECGVMSVPEDRAQTDSPVVHIAYAVLKSRARQAAPDPVLVLEGGPGDGALDRAAEMARVFDKAREARDILLFDARGTGYSTRIGCDALQAQSPQPWGACAAALHAAGRDARRYGSADSAADAADLLNALEYAQVNLYGVDYGSRVALQFLRLHEDRTRSVVLDSVAPANVRVYEELPAAENAAIMQVFADCEADPACAARFPGVTGRWLALLEALARQPAEPSPGVVLDGRALAELARDTVRDLDGLPRLPLLVDELERGVATTYEQLDADLRRQAPADPASLPLDGLFARVLAEMEREDQAGAAGQLRASLASLLESAELAAMQEAAAAIIDQHLSGADAALLRGLVERMNRAELSRLPRAAAAGPAPGARDQAAFLAFACVEEILLNDPEAARSNASALPMGAYLSLGRDEADRPECEQFGLKAAPPSAKAPVVSGVPVLILAGRYDTRSSPAWARAVAATLPRSAVVEVPAGHRVMPADPCAARLAQSFVKEPGRALNVGCVARPAFALKAQASAAPRLSGDWRITSFGVPGAEWAVLPQAPAWLRLAANGSLSGSAGCGNLSGRHTAAHGLLTIAPLDAAPKACGEAAERQAVRLQRALSSAVSAVVSGQSLRIDTRDGLVIRAQKGAARASSAPAFIGTTWHLRSASTGGAPLTLDRELAFSLSFEVDGRLHARTACGAADGTYKAQGKQLVLRAPAMPEAACPPDLAAQQQTVWQALKGVTSFSLANGQLALTGQRGKTVLRFAPPGPAALANTRWRLAWLLVAGARTEAPGDAGISLSFDERGSAGGVIGCNSFTGAYQAFGQALSFADLKATSLTCGDDLARLEHAYLDALGDVAAYGASSGRLELRDAAGRALMAFEIAGQ